MKPIFKWSGGKRKELPIIREYVPNEFNTYYEPFVGAGAVWLDLLPHKSVINDANIDLIDFYRGLKEKVGLIEELNLLAEQYNQSIKQANPQSKSDYGNIPQDFFYYWRDNSFDNLQDKAKAFYMTRQLCFGGMVRYNKSGKFNVPYGYYKSMKMLDIDLGILQDLLQNTEIHLGDWRNSVESVSGSDFVFLDPPYTRIFKNYSGAGDFSKQDQIRLADWFKTTNAKVMIVINYDELTRSLYDEYIQEVYDFKYAIRYRDRVSDDDLSTKHILATNY